MKTTHLITSLRRLVGTKPDDVAAISKAFEAISQELSAAQQESQALEASFSARLTEALIEGMDAKAQGIENEVQASQHKVERLARAREAVASRLQAAQEAVQTAEQLKRWAALDHALRRRRLALVRFQVAIADAGKALLTAEAAARDALAAMPESPGAGTHFTALDGEVGRLMARATGGRAGGYVGSALWDLERQPDLVARADSAASEWLKLRPAGLLGEELPPEAA
jgi:hypothetical protein